jgi:hypothetical protein
MQSIKQQQKTETKTTTTKRTTTTTNNNEFLIIYLFLICRLNGCESNYRNKTTKEQTGTKSNLKKQFVVQDQTIILKLIRNLLQI